MKINEEIIEYKKNIPCEAAICSISRTSPHYHNGALELVCCLNGSVDIVAGHQNVTVRSGEIFSVDCRDIHYLYSDEDNLVLVFHLDLTRLDTPWDYLRDAFFACESIHCRPYQRSALNSVKDIILSISHELFSEESHRIDTDRMGTASNRLMDILMRYFNWFNYEDFDEHFNVEHYERFYRLLSYCCKNYSHKITIPELAAMEHISRNYVSQFFRRTVFESFSNMLKYVRCYEAERLLLKTDMPVAEISYACGFSDPKYFYSAFKRWWGCTPTEDRQKYRKYITGGFSVTRLEPDVSLKIIRDQITDWHIEKTLH